MNRLLRDTRSKEGCSSKIHGDAFDECADLGAVLIGHLVFDEMKLKTGSSGKRQITLSAA
jgi:hypothetical protein